MATPVKIRRSGTATATPSSLEHGEIAINYADGKVFWKDASNVITSFTFQSYALASHTHAASDITSGTLDAARLPLATTGAAGAMIVGTGLGVSSGTVSVTYGTSSGTACEGNDARLSDARTPTSHTHGSISNDGAIGFDADQFIVTTTDGVLTAVNASTARSTLGVQPTASPAFTGAASFGNTIAVGATLSSWASNAGVVQTANYASLSAFNDPSLHLTLNAYYDGANWVYISSAAASNYYQLGGEHIWRGAASGTAGTNVSWTTRLTISATGTATFAGQIVGQAGMDVSGAATFANTGNVVPVTVTNTGTANSFVVNDASGDTTPFVIDAAGNVGVGLGGAPNARVQVNLGDVAPAASGDMNTGVVFQSNGASRAINIGTDNTAGYSWINAAFANNSGIADNLHLMTGATTRLTISSTGTATFAGQIVGQAGAAISGTTALGDTVNVGTASTTATIVNVGVGATGNRFALIDVIGDTTYTDYGLRIGRDNGGANGQSIIHHRGTGSLAVVAIDAGTVELGTNSTTRLTISSTGTATFAGQVLVTAGSVSACSVAPTGDPNTGLYFPAANVAAIVTDGYERVRVDASGNVGVGEQSPTQKMHVVGAVASFGGTTSYDQSCIQISYDSGVGTVTSSGAPGAIAFRTNITGNFTAERMRIAGDGAITMPEVYADTVGATNRDLYIDDTGLIGYVSSIRESKTDIVTLDDVSWLSALSPVSYRYRKQDADGNYTDEADGVTDYGLIAEDVEAVKPELCFYDMVDGEPQLRGVTYSKLITPMLRYIQQLEQRIAALEERINA